jgi:glucuronyl esterase-like protein
MESVIMKNDWYSVSAIIAVGCAAAVGTSCTSRENAAGVEATPGSANTPTVNAGESGNEAAGVDARGNANPGDANSGIGNPSGATGNDGATSGGPGSNESASASGINLGTSLGAGAGGPSPARPAYAYAATVENLGADCQIPALAEPGQLPRLEKLPDPFQRLDGTRVTRQSEWRCRRQELLKQAEKYIYGQKPPKPEKVSGSVSNDTISVDVEQGGTSIHFSAEVVLPQGTGPFPAIINLGARNSSGGITLGESFILDQGVAIIFYNHYDLGQEGQPEASRGLPNPGLFYDIYGGDHSAGLLMAWAWGASRVLDVLQGSGGNVIDPERVGVTGCSRNGKGAFTVGVFDERIALTIPQETSTAGVPAYRIVDVTNGAERTNWNYYGLNWLSNDFLPFVENASQLPIDSHEMVAMVAPRGLLVLDNPHVAQFAASSAHTAVLAGAEVYAALGAAGNVSYVSDVLSEVHCESGKPEYKEALTQSISKFLKHEGEAPGILRAGATATGDLSQWRDWQTPVLESEPPN